ncbi:50S ribosomal protein L10 [Buchnera aphidicola]|uniref:50S ribosomal protein L10 n=1 Tax=Buchnera aphidicola TaxID=9 RepID=UPI003463B443
MALNLQQKKNIVTKINKIAKSSKSAIIAKIKKISVNKINKLRKNSRKKNVLIYIIKNTLLKISLQDTHLQCLNNKIAGSIIIGFSKEHPGSAAKLFNSFSKKNKNFKIISATLNGKILSQSEIIQLSNLPTYEEAIIRLIITIKNATIGKLITVLQLIKKKIKT